MDKINLTEKFGAINEYWHPHIIANLNNQDVKLVKLKGEFTWHHHENEDELFFVVNGSFDMHFRDKIVTVNKGELIVAPKKVEHKPVATEECWVLLFEPSTTLNTGNIINEFTKSNIKTI
jgi:mannose-6-phosphate isomerase-like protein (cupin superfamily)